MIFDKNWRSSSQYLFNTFFFPILNILFLRVLLHVWLFHTVCIEAIHCLQSCILLCSSVWTISLDFSLSPFLLCSLMFNLLFILLKQFLFYRLYHSLLRFLVISSLQLATLLKFFLFIIIPVSHKVFWNFYYTYYVTLL